MKRIAIISPATEVREFLIDGAAEELRRRGFDVEIASHAKGPRCGTYAASDALRLEDLNSAILDPDVDIILCARGGYGCNHLLSKRLEQFVRDYPKWLIGFSDVSALHALWLKAGAPSIHSSMAKQLTLYLNTIVPPEERDCHIGEIEENGKDNREKYDLLVTEEIETPEDIEDIRYCTEAMFDLLEGKDVEYEEPGDERNIPGRASGIIVGGNLAVLNGLAATPWDILSKNYLRDKILFLEDVGEKIYQVERMMKRLQLTGALNKVAAIVMGKFTDYKPDRNFESMEAMLSSRFREWGIKCPVAFGFPIGHINRNLPIAEGAKAYIDIRRDVVKLKIFGI